MAKTDEAARRIYKYLIALHSDCNDILQLVKESGTLSREIKDLEEQVGRLRIVTKKYFILFSQIALLRMKRRRGKILEPN